MIQIMVTVSIECGDTFKLFKTGQQPPCFLTPPSPYYPLSSPFLLASYMRLPVMVTFDRWQYWKIQWSLRITDPVLSSKNPLFANVRYWKIRE